MLVFKMFAKTIQNEVFLSQNLNLEFGKGLKNTMTPFTKSNIRKECLYSIYPIFYKIKLQFGLYITKNSVLFAYLNVSYHIKRSLNKLYQNYCLSVCNARRRVFGCTNFYEYFFPLFYTYTSRVQATFNCHKHFGNNMAAAQKSTMVQFWTPVSICGWMNNLIIVCGY